MSTKNLARSYVVQEQANPLSPNVLKRPGSAIDRSTEISTLSDAFTAFSSLTKQNGLDYFMLANHPGVGVRSTQDDILATNLPSYIFAELVEIDLFSNWSITETMTRRSSSFWSFFEPAGEDPLLPVGLANPAEADEGSYIDGFLNQRLGICCVYCVPLATTGSRKPFLALMAENDCAQDIRQAELSFQTQEIFDRLEKLLGRQNRSYSNVLTKRQTECLKWASLGKTSGEISLILGLSEHTVNHYLNTCCKLLDCVNRTQAVAQAIRLQIIK
ncbi:MAG: helix-turn-helix transcriptional regulator [Pseudomonadota bacterium]